LNTPVLDSNDLGPLQFAYATHEVRVVFGAGSLGSLPDELSKLGVARVMLLATPGRAKQVEALSAMLGEHLAGIFTKAEMHVPADVVRAALTELARLKPDACVALGGGSAIGLGKAIVRETGLPLVAIPTTYSGSEMTAIWGTTEGKMKRTERDPRVAARLVLYDAELTLDLPPATSAASGMNAMAHCVEALYAADASPASSLFAEDGIRRLARSLPVVMRAPHDITARADALAGAHLAGRSLDMTSMGLHHKLCHVLGGSFGLPHAETHAAILPYVVSFNTPSAPAAMASIARALGATDAAGGLYGLSRGIGTARPLSELGFKAEDIPRAAAIAMKGVYPNPRPVTEQAVRQLLQAAFSGEPPA
jgi:maleylacetate reductase